MWWASLAKLIFNLPFLALHVVSQNSFPRPLSKKDETKYIKMLAEGNENAKNKLINHNLRLVAHISKKYRMRSNDCDDLISIGTIGLIKAVNTFKPDKGVRLSSYAARCIENEILMYLRKSSQLKNEMSIDVPFNIDWDGNELLLSDVLGSEHDVVNHRIEQEVECNLLLNAVNRLSEREKKIMQMRFGLEGYKEHTQKEVADLLGISQSYISRLEKRIIERLKKDLEKVY